MALSEDEARRLLALDFGPEVHARYEYLSRQANRGKLTKPESEELDAMLELNNLVTLFKAEVRIFLKKRGGHGESKA